MPFDIEPQPHRALGYLRLGFEVGLGAGERCDMDLRRSDGIAVLDRSDTRDTTEVEVEDPGGERQRQERCRIGEAVCVEEKSLVREDLLKSRGGEGVGFENVDKRVGRLKEVASVSPVVAARLNDVSSTDSFKDVEEHSLTDVHRASTLLRKRHHLVVEHVDVGGEVDQRPCELFEVDFGWSLA